MDGLNSTSFQPVRLLGASLFIGAMAAGYLYNITFVQLGLTDLGEQVLALPPERVAGIMALFALVTCAAALAFGYWLMRTGFSSSFRIKARSALLALIFQTVLTLWAPSIQTESAFILWIVLSGLAMGLAVPATFGLAADLVPVAWRGWAAGAITAIAYLAANLLPVEWQVEPLAHSMSLVMPAGLALFALLSFARHPWIERWSEQHRQPSFGRGRYAQAAGPEGAIHWRLLLVFALMFAVFFIDSLGFLRLLDSPRYMLSAWQSPELGVRLALGLTHVVGALIGAVFYTQLGNRALFLSIFGTFALTHLLYTMPSAGGEPPLATPLLYSLSVSLYTVVNFALWADISTPGNITFQSARGVAISGWTATFMSTALALRWRANGVPLLRHLQNVDALAMLMFLGMIFYLWLAPTVDQPKVRGSLEQ